MVEVGDGSRIPVGPHPKDSIEIVVVTSDAVIAEAVLYALMSAAWQSWMAVAKEDVGFVSNRCFHGDGHSRSKDDSPKRVTRDGELRQPVVLMLPFLSCLSNRGGMPWARPPR